MDIAALGISLQFSALTLIIVFIVLAARDAWHVAAARYAILALIGIGALFLQLPGLPAPAVMVIRLIDTLASGLIWWSALALIEEDFRPRAFHWLGLAASAGSILPWRFVQFGWIESVNPHYPLWMPDAIVLILFGYLAWVIIQGFSDDLITRRRRLRAIMLVFITITTLIAAIGENFIEAAGYGSIVIAFTALTAIPALFGVLFWLTRLQPEILAFQPTKPAEASAPVIRPQDANAHAKLIHIMETERAWAEAGLTIGALAGKVGVPEHQLRALINRGMGYRNFASFLSSYRLAYAKSVLADIDQARLPVLTIAMDAGFGSLAPFNRAFKAAEGITPSEYRAQKLSGQN